jgi:hypothetical protein
VTVTVPIVATDLARCIARHLTSKTDKRPDLEPGDKRLEDSHHAPLESAP